MTEGNHQLSLLVNSALQISQDYMLDELLQNIFDQTRKALDIEVLTLALINPKAYELEIRASSNIHNLQLTGLRFKINQEFTKYFQDDADIIIIPVTETQKGLFDKVFLDAGIKIQTEILIAIRKQKNVIGIIEALNPTSGQFNTDTITTLKGIGHLALLAINNSQLTEDLKCIRQRYSDVFESGINAIIISDLSGNIVELNQQAAQIIGVDISNIRQLNLHDLNIIDKKFVGEDYSVLLAGESVTYHANVMLHKNKAIPVHIHACIVYLGGCPHIQWTLRDISEQAETETLRNDLITMIYHDLRSPLANIVSSLDVLETLLPLTNDDALKSLLNIAIRSAERIQRLTNSLLDMRKIEVGGIVTNFQAISPSRILKESVESVHFMASTKKQTIKMNIAPDSSDVRIDADMIRRVLINLLENAIKFSPDGSEIIIGAIKKEKYTEFFVKDNGPGIPITEKERIFDKFSRLHPDSVRGFGLGLAYCRLAVEAHGGEIWVDCGENRGACFRFTIPSVAAFTSRDNQANY